MTGVFSRPPRVTEWLVLACIFAGSMRMLAQGSGVATHGAKTMETVAPPVATASVRFWKTDLKSFPTLNLIMMPVSGKHAAEHEIGSTGPGYDFADYQQVPTGRCILKLSQAATAMSGKPLVPLVSTPADFNVGAFFTVLVTEGSGPNNTPRLEIIEDAHGGERLAQISVRNFVLGSKDMHVSIGEVLNAQFASGTSLLVMSGVQPAVYQVHASGNSSNGKMFEWNTVVDLKQNRHQTLLIYPDPYGRIRPRLSVDGEVPAEGRRSEGQR